MIPKETTYPVFEANQVLTNRHLNDLFEYLDEQNRLTRTNLIGIGIVCGLEVEKGAGDTSVIISKGCGVTSEGYLAVLPDDPSAPPASAVTLTHWKEYKVPEELDYPPFYDTSVTPRVQYPLWEMFPDNEPGSLPLTPDFLKGKVVLLFVECFQDELKNCSPNSCDDKGMEVSVTIRKLLIQQADLIKIIQKAEGLSPNLNSSGLTAALTARMYLPDLKLRRFDVPNSAVDTAAEIFLAYRKILMESFPASASSSLFEHVGKALSKAYAAFLPVVEDLAPSDPFTGLMAGIQSRYLSNFANANIIYSQYFYDFLDEVIQAYDEFRWKGLELVAQCCPPAGLFPRHLMLGELDSQMASGKKVYRHYFRPSPVQVSQARLAQEVRHLFQRLVLMLSNFDVPSATSLTRDPDPVRVTPSRLGAYPLSQKAISFHYKVKNGKPALFERWSFEKTAADRADQNLSFHAAGYAAQDFVKNPLHYDLEPNNFFRVEGHIGLSWRRVITGLLGKLKTYRLPFDVIALNAHNLAVLQNPQPAHCQDNDLDVIYKLWSEEVLCLFKKTGGYITRLNLSDFKFTKTLTATAGSSKAATAASGLAGVSAVKATSSILSVNPAVANLDIKPAISTEEGTLGHLFLNVTNSLGNVSAAVLQVQLTQAVQQNQAVANLPVAEYQVAVGYPLELTVALYDLSQAIPDNVEDMDYEAVDLKYNRLVEVATLYRDRLKALPPNSVVLPDRDKTVAELEKLIETCLNSRRKALKAELDKRKKAAESLLFFSEYVKKHPEIQHKAGVPVGGTFILVFLETPRTRPPVVSAGNLVANIGDLTATPVFTANPAAGAAVTSAAVKTEGLTLAQDIQVTETPSVVEGTFFTREQITLNLMNSLAQAGVAVTELDILPVIDQVLAATTVFNPKVPVIPEGVVIADFYLPYRCCSDCPPVQFVLPPPRPAFTAEPGCPDPNNTALITLTVLAGSPPYQFFKIEGETRTPLTEPVQLIAGTHTLMLVDSEGGESLPVTVEVPNRMVVTTGQAECDKETFSTYNLEIFVFSGKPPFTVNGQPPLDTSGLRADGSIRIVAGKFPSGQPVDIEVKDSSECPPVVIPGFMKTCLPPPPTASNITITTPFNTPVTISVQGHTGGTGLKVSIPSQPAEGKVEINSDMAFTFTPKPEAAGKTAVFSYTVTDAVGQSATAQVLVAIGQKPCNLPCDGKAERCRYPLWMSMPTGENAYRFTEVAKLTITDKTTGQVIFDDSLMDIFKKQLAPGTVLTANNFKDIFTNLLDLINKFVAEKIGKGVFILRNDDVANGGVLSVEHFVCHAFRLEIMFGMFQNLGQVTVSGTWIYNEESVEVQQKSPFQATFKVAKFGCDQQDKCSEKPPVLAGRSSIKNIDINPNRNLIAVTSPPVVVTKSRFDWVLEWNNPPFMKGEQIFPPVIAERAGKARLIVVDENGKWDYFERVISFGTNPSTGTGGITVRPPVVPVTPVVTGSGTVRPVVRGGSPATREAAAPEKKATKKKADTKSPKKKT